MPLEFVPFKGFGPYRGPWEDIRSHCRVWTPYPGDGKMTEAHENTHQIHAEMRNRLVGEGYAFYILEDRAITFRPPKVTLRDVAKRVAKKGPVFGLYVVDSQKWWNTQPLYVLDEAVAYVNGAIVGEQYGGVEWEYEADRARELTVYAWALIKAIEELDPDYPDLEKLVAFVNFNVARLPDFRAKIR